MAKIKLQGNASGTGVITLTAPNTSTDRTITLPDATGTLLNSDGDGSSLTGVADATKLPLAGGTMTNTLTIQNNVSSNTDPSLILSGTSNASQDSYMQMGAMFTSNPVAMGLDNSSNLFKIARNSTGNISSGEHLVINPSGVVSVPNGIELGSGIDATAANTLEDYEEGTWTPANQWITITNEVTARYVKIGNMVTVWGNITFAASPADVSQTGGRIQGLPFTPLGGDHPFLGSWWGNTSTGARKPDNYDFFVNASTTLQIYNRTSSRVAQRQQVANTHLKFQAIYQVA